MVARGGLATTGNGAPPPPPKLGHTQLWVTHGGSGQGHGVHTPLREVQHVLGQDLIRIEDHVLIVLDAPRRVAVRRGKDGVVALLLKLRGAETRTGGAALHDVAEEARQRGHEGALLRALPGPVAPPPSTPLHRRGQTRETQVKGGSCTQTSQREQYAGILPQVPD